MDADLYVDFWWKGKLELIHGHRVVKQVSSHRWEQARYSMMNTKKLATKHLRASGAVAVPSLRLHAMLASLERMPEVSICMKGFHPELMGDFGGRRGPLTVGWAGNASASDKRVLIIASAFPDLRVADQCLTQEEMGDFYNGCDVITCASTAEGDPRTLIEGLACGCFYVGVDVGIVPELVRDGIDGIIVERNAESFAAALRWCTENIDQVRDAGRRNAERMRATRSWDIASRSWGNAFDRAIARATAEACGPTLDSGSRPSGPTSRP